MHITMETIFEQNDYWDPYLHVDENISWVKGAARQSGLIKLTVYIVALSYQEKLIKFKDNALCLVSQTWP